MHSRQSIQPNLDWIVFIKHFLFHFLQHTDNYKNQLQDSMQTKSKIMSSGLLKKPIMLLLLKLDYLNQYRDASKKEKDILLKLLPLSIPALFRASLLISIKNVLSTKDFWRRTKNVWGEHTGNKKYLLEFSFLQKKGKSAAQCSNSIFMSHNYQESAVFSVRVLTHL